ncbi:MAG: 4'-phosphopantetheinyl transferase family protein [Thermincolia bacterium]
MTNYKGFQFNISHSGDLVVCAVDYQPVGIDVELIDKPHLEVAERFFTRDEYRDLISKEGLGYAIHS